MACGILVPQPGIEGGAPESTESYPLDQQGVTQKFIFNNKNSTKIFI